MNQFFKDFAQVGYQGDWSVVVAVKFVIFFVKTGTTLTNFIEFGNIPDEKLNITKGFRQLLLEIFQYSCWNAVGSTGFICSYSVYYFFNVFFTSRTLGKRNFVWIAQIVVGGFATGSNRFVNLTSNTSKEVVKMICCCAEIGNCFIFNNLSLMVDICFCFTFNMDLTADQTFFVYTFFVLIKIFFKRYILKRGTT